MKRIYTSKLSRWVEINYGNEIYIYIFFQKLVRLRFLIKLDVDEPIKKIMHTLKDKTVCQISTSGNNNLFGIFNFHLSYIK